MDNFEEFPDSDRYDLGGDEFIDSVTGIDTFDGSPPSPIEQAQDVQRVAHRLHATINATTEGDWQIESDSVESYTIVNLSTGAVVASGFKNFYDAQLLVFAREKGAVLTTHILGL